MAWGAWASPGRGRVQGGRVQGGRVQGGRVQGARGRCAPRAAKRARRNRNATTPPMVFSIFSRRGFDAAVFEQELDSLTQQIDDAHTHALALKLRARRTRARLIEVAVQAYVVVVLYLYYTTPQWQGDASRWRNFWRGQSRLRLAVVLGAPLAVAAVVAVVARFFGALQRRQRARIAALTRKRDAKIEELKHATHFDSANEMLRRYGGQGKAEGETNAKASAAGHAGGLTAGQAGPGVPREVALVARAPDRTYQDRILDLIIGVDASERAENRFALICPQCYSHNGLAPPGCASPATVRYRCPHCGYMNGGEGEPASSGLEAVADTADRAAEASDTAGRLAELVEPQSSLEAAETALADAA